MKFDICGTEYSAEIFDNKGIGTNYFRGSDLIFTSRRWWSPAEDKEFLTDWHYAANHMRTEKHGYLRPFSFVDENKDYSGTPLIRLDD